MSMSLAQMITRSSEAQARAAAAACVTLPRNENGICLLLFVDLMTHCSWSTVDIAHWVNVCVGTTTSGYLASRGHRVGHECRETQ